MMTDQHAFVSTSVCEQSGERACCDGDTLVTERPEIVCEMQGHRVMV